MSSRALPRRVVLALAACSVLAAFTFPGQAQTAPAAGPATRSLLLSPEDTVLDLDATNYSGDTTLATYTWPDHRPAKAILLRFDLTVLPPGAVVHEATLRLALVDSDANAEATYTVAAHKVLGRRPVIAAATGHTADGAHAWSPNACCSGGVPLAQADLSPAYDRRAIDKAAGYKPWTLTRMVQEWRADPTTNFGLLLNADVAQLGDRYRVFASAEHPEAGIRPVLGVTYSVPPSSAALSPRDTYLNLDATNYSAQATLATYTWPDRSVANAILMKFDLASLPATAVVHEATLRLALVASDAAPEATYGVTASKVIGQNPDVQKATGYTIDGTKGWTANACCHDGVPLAQADLSPAHDAREIDKTPGYKVWTVTRMVQEWLADPARNFGLLLNADASKPRDRYRYFASMEDPDTSRRPVLQIAYTLPSGTLSLSPEDTFLNLDATSYSTRPRLRTYTWPHQRPANAILMKFDLPGLPAGAVMEEATLHLALTASDAKPEPTYAVAARKVVGKNPAVAAATGYTFDGVRAWTANTCCYDGVPLAQADVSPPYDARDVDKARGYKVWTITRMVQEWLADPAGNFGLLLDPNVSAGPLMLRDRYRSFASMEDPDAGVRPFLRIAYTLPPAGDTTPPAVAVTAPAGGATVAGTVTVAAGATDDVGVAGVQFELDGANLGAEDTASPYSVSWNTTTVLDGNHTLTAVARDAAGNATTSASITVTVANGTVVTLAPQDTFISLDTTSHSTEAQLRTYTWPDNRLANAILMKFDLSALPAGAVVGDATLQLALVGSDTAAETTYTVTAHKVVAKNPVITAVTGYTADGVTAWTPNTCCYNSVPLAQADISAAYDTRGIDKTLGFKSWTIMAMVQEWLDAPTTNFGLLLNSDASKLADRHRSFASMEHADPSLRPFLRIGYTVPPPDPTPPTVSMTAPAAGTSVSGTVTVSATASDNVGVASVQFQLDGANLGAKDTTAPYSISWDTTSASAGYHTLTAVARDAAGNSTTSAGVTVTVVDVTAPVISAVTASGITTSAAAIAWTTNEASDSQVEYGTTTAYGSTTTLNVNLVTAHTAALTGLSASTVYHYRVRSRDAAGNLATSGDFTFTTLAVSTGTGIAALYPGDVGIETHSDVVFTEMFEEASLSEMTSRYNDVANSAGMAFTTSIPAGSAGSRSLQMTSVVGSSESTGLYKLLSPGSGDQWYLRYYVNYSSSVVYGHAGTWLGGYNPPLTYPNPQAGVKPSGNDRFSVGPESLSTASDLWMSYTYWKDMRASGGTYWGNNLLNEVGQTMARNRWYCLEAMVKLNNPVSDTNGELAIWIDGQKILHMGKGFPKGTWSGGQFTPSSSGTAFEGFQWRSDPALLLNYIWLQNYVNDSSSGSVGKVMFDHLVLAKSRVGCLAPGPADTTAPTVSLSAPIAGATVFGTAVTVSASASDNVGVAGVQFKVDGVNLGAEDTTSPYSVSWNTTTLPNGSHTLTAVARDAAGNTTTSAGVTVTVSNLATTAWPNQPSGFRMINDQPWDFLTGNGWNYLRRTSSKDASIVLDSAAPLTPLNELRMVFTTDMTKDTEPSVHWIGLSPRPNEIYTAWWGKVSSDWQCSPAGCGKITFLWAPDGQGQVYTNYYHPESGSGPPYRIGANTEWSPYGQKIWYPNVTTTLVYPGEWHRIEFHYKYESSPGAGDGIIRWWVDGVLNGDYRTVQYPGCCFQQFEFAPTLQNPPTAEQYMYIDHTFLSTP